MTDRFGQLGDVAVFCDLDSLKPISMPSGLSSALKNVDGAESRRDVYNRRRPATTGTRIKK